VHEGDQTRQLALDLFGISAVPPKTNRLEPWNYDCAMYKKSNEIERLFRKLKRFRRIFSRFDKLDEIFAKAHIGIPNPLFLLNQNFIK